MANVDAAIATFERNIEISTGRSVSAWAELVRGQGLQKHGQMVAWLKTEHAFSHGHANHVAKRALEAAAPRSGDDPVAHLFEGKEAMRPLYDRMAALAVALGPDVEIAPKKANASVRRRRQFALLQPSTRTRLDLGLILPGREASGRLEASGGFNAMFTHRVKLAGVEEIDAEVESWLKDAYDAAK
jgi:hypothetical protein